MNLTALDSVKESLRLVLSSGDYVSDIASSLDASWCKNAKFWTFATDVEMTVCIADDEQGTMVVIPKWWVQNPAQDAMRRYQLLLASAAPYLKQVNIEVEATFLPFFSSSRDAGGTDDVILPIHDTAKVLSFGFAYDHMRFYIAPVHLSRREAYGTLVNVLSASHRKLSECAAIRSPRRHHLILEVAMRQDRVRLPTALLHAAVMCMTFEPLAWIWIAKLLLYLDERLLRQLMRRCSWLRELPEAAMWLYLLAIWEDDVVALEIFTDRIRLGKVVLGQSPRPRDDWCSEAHFARLVYVAIMRRATASLSYIINNAVEHWIRLDGANLYLDSIDGALPHATLADLMRERGIITPSGPARPLPYLQKF